ncbi:MAG TPA: hypothetical protein VGC79_12300, partial [Polyangiaceae bacterium]
MFRQIRFECGACGEGFVDWHDDDWERSPVYCVHCGRVLVAGGALQPGSFAQSRSSAAEGHPARALGVLKADGEGFRDTLPGLTEELTPTHAEAPDASRDRDTEPPLPRVSGVPGASQATSTAPKATTSHAFWAQHRRTLAPIAALLLGFAAGVVTALLAENPLLRLMNPAAYQSQRLTEQLSLVSSAIDQGDWQRARDLLSHAAAGTPRGDSRLATLRARLTLGLILAHRPSEAGHELSAVPKLASVHPSAADLQRVYDAWFPTQVSAPTTNVAAPALASPVQPKPKVVVTKRELLSFARDRQQRAKLDEADRLYAEALRRH